MKKLILFVLVSFGLLNQSSAQSFIVQGTDTTTSYYSGPGDISVVNLIKSTGSDVYLRWKVTDSHFDANWSTTGFCDNTLCYPYSAALLNGAYHTSSAYTSAQWGDFHALFNGNNAANNSVAWMQVLATDTVTHYSRTLTFIARKSPAGVISVTRSDDNISLYPNPAKDYLNIVFDANAGVKNITVYNLIGKAVSVFKVNGNSAKLDIDNIPSGIYFVRLQDAQGRTIATRKFTHQ